MSYLNNGTAGIDADVVITVGYAIGPLASHALLLDDVVNLFS